MLTRLFLLMCVILIGNYVEGNCRPNFEIKRPCDLRKNYEKKLYEILGPIIVGGKKVKGKDYPYQLALEIYGRFACGASIISKKWALSAAHCLTGFTDDNYQLRSGTDFKEKGGQVHQIKRVVAHPKYSAERKIYDFSLFEVVEPFNFGNIGVSKVKITTKEPAVGSKVFITGWGSTEEKGETSKDLQGVEVTVISRKICNESYHGLITDLMFCAGTKKGGKDSCQGDSGGPVVNMKSVLVGVISFGTGCARADYPGVIGNVVKARDWIKNVTGLDKI